MPPSPCAPLPLSAPQVETGNPYMLFKDHANRKSNQQNLGTIKCSNLCTEIIEFTRWGRRTPHPGA